MEEIIDQLLEDENRKTLVLGNTHKQCISNLQIHQVLIEKGFDIGVTTVTNVVREERIKIIYKTGEIQRVNVAT
ncbi:hypothetical protein [Mycoplasma sp. P36-A1]|uniref:hypothetical protein n=1 Tax=Mycoplasma sp. P36-A1 TaxID=3252900 RepID=UPI003C2F63E1